LYHCSSSLSRVFCLQSLCFLPKGSLVRRQQQKYLTLSMCAFEGALSIITREEHCSFWDLYTICRSLNKGRTQQQGSIKILGFCTIDGSCTFTGTFQGSNRWSLSFNSCTQNQIPNSLITLQVGVKQVFFFFFIGNWNRKLGDKRKSIHCTLLQRILMKKMSIFACETGQQIPAGHYVVFVSGNISGVYHFWLLLQIVPIGSVPSALLPTLHMSQKSLHFSRHHHTQRRDSWVGITHY
jgi:hypothetical protein